MVEVNQREQAVPGVDPEGFSDGRDRVKLVPFAKGIKVQLSMAREEGESIDAWVDRVWLAHGKFCRAFGVEG